MRSKLLGALGLFVCISCASAVHSQPNNPPVSQTTCSESACPIQKPHTTERKEQAAEPPKILSTPPETETVAQCPVGMIYVQGEYCPTVRQTCLYAVDANGNKIPFSKPFKNKLGKTIKWPDRCGEWKYPTECLSKKIHKSFCIDKYEYPNIKDHIPQSWMSWHDVKAVCEAQGKRLCNKSEWTFACEGPDMKPYPYGDGYHRDKTACNFDRTNYQTADCMPVKDKTGKMVPQSTDAPCRIRLDNLLVPSGSQPACVSPFGVYDMVGNIDEEVVNETHIPYRSGLVGGHVFGVRNACRPMTEAHEPEFFWYETGGRCCDNSKASD